MVSAVLQASCGNRGFAAPGLRLPGDRMVLGYRAAADRLPHRTARADPVGVDAGCTRDADFLRYQATRELCDVLCLVCAVSAVAGAGEQPDALLRVPVQSIHPRG